MGCITAILLPPVTVIHPLMSSATVTIPVAAPISLIASAIQSVPDTSSHTHKSTAAQLKPHWPQVLASEDIPYRKMAARCQALDGAHIAPMACSPGETFSSNAQLQPSLAAAAVPDTRLPLAAASVTAGASAGGESGVGIGAGRGGTGGGAGGVVRAVAAALPSVVGIVVGGTVWGSGVIISPSGLILTNAHILTPLLKERMQQADAGEAGQSQHSSGLAVRPIRPSASELECGSTAVVIGYAVFPPALATPPSVFSGIVSRIVTVDPEHEHEKEHPQQQQQEQRLDITESSSTGAPDGLRGGEREVEACLSTAEQIGEHDQGSRGGKRGGRVAAMVLTTAAVHAGASGGAVVNAQGEMIALVTSNAKHNRHGTILPHLNFSIPLALLQPIFHFASSLHTSLHSSHHTSHHSSHHTSHSPHSFPPPFSPAWASVVHPLLSLLLLPLNTPSPAIHALWSLAPSSHLTPPDVPRLISPSVQTNRPRL
ncbi:unnamed protein product [Closterium sp. Yama58-4]|nr:unnamed protein product [Closterium sp. Yama58-4]